MMRTLIKSAQHKHNRRRAFSLIILVLCLNIIAVTVCIHSAPCHLKLHQSPCKPGKVGVLKMLQGALTGVYKMEQPCDEVLLVETDNVFSSIVLRVQKAIWLQTDAKMRLISSPLYLQNSSFLC